MSKLNAPPCIDALVVVALAIAARPARESNQETHVTRRTCIQMRVRAYVRMRERRVRVSHVYPSYITYLCSHVVRVYPLEQQAAVPSALAHRAPTGISHIGHRWHSVTQRTNMPA